MRGKASPRSFNQISMHICRNAEADEEDGGHIHAAGVGIPAKDGQRPKGCCRKDHKPRT